MFIKFTGVKKAPENDFSNTHPEAKDWFQSLTEVLGGDLTAQMC